MAKSREFLFEWCQEDHNTGGGKTPDVSLLIEQAWASVRQYQHLAGLASDNKIREAAIQAARQGAKGLRLSVEFVLKTEAIA